MYVYGAGIYGLATIRLLLKYEIPVSAVLVTEPAGNPENILGIPVIDAHKLANDSSHCMAIIAVSDKCSNEKIKKKLEEKNMSIIIGFEETPFVYGN